MTRLQENRLTIGVATSAGAKRAVFRERYKALQETAWIGPKSHRYTK